MSFTVPTAEDYRYQESVTLTVINCGECGGSYAINERYREQKARTGGSWSCPYCRVWWGYAGDNSPLAIAKRKAAELERSLELERKRKEWAQQDAKRAENRRRAEKAAKTRIKNRVAKGVCPCCNRSFANLHRHMASQHPEFAKQGEEA